jgi:uncharacterized protein YdeI (YjbR/CyaY-like superfamily)
MPTPNPSNIKAFTSAADLGRWLEKYHTIENELWVQMYKKGSGVPSVNWNEVVIEALCWGWIDGIKKSFDEQSFLQRITPRTSRSNWSKINTEHVERLIASGRMQPQGLIHVDAAKADGRWDNAYAPPSEMKVPDDFLEALERKPKAKRFFATLTKSQQYTIAYGLASAKKPETRLRRFEKFMDMLERGEKP